MTLHFEWDEAKAAANLNKHGVSFEEAQTVFSDPESLTIFDERHFEQEDRYIDVGLSIYGRLLVVVYTERGTTIRIISSRPATPNEHIQYERRDV